MIVTSSKRSNPGSCSCIQGSAACMVTSLSPSKDSGPPYRQVSTHQSSQGTGARPAVATTVITSLCHKRREDATTCCWGCASTCSSWVNFPSCIFQKCVMTHRYKGVMLGPLPLLLCPSHSLPTCQIHQSETGRNSICYQPMPGKAGGQLHVTSHNNATGSLTPGGGTE